MQQNHKPAKPWSLAARKHWKVQCNHWFIQNYPNLMLKWETFISAKRRKETILAKKISKSPTRKSLSNFWKTFSGISSNVDKQWWDVDFVPLLFYYYLHTAHAYLLICIYIGFFSFFQVNWGMWDIPKMYCDFYIASDVICSTSSIFNLVAISIDR